MAYNVYLFDLLDAIPPNTANPIKVTLQEYFDKVSKGTNFNTAYVRWETSKPTVADHELVIYFMPGTHSIVAVMLGKPLASPGAFGRHWGQTQQKTVQQSTRTASEVINKATGSTTTIAKQLANLAFHEAMHNKLRLTNQQLHNGDGLRGSAFVNAADPGGLVTDTTLLTQTNITDMARVLNNKVPQWTDGISTLLFAKQRKDAGGDAWDL